MHTLQAAPGCSPSSTYLDIVSCVTCLLGIFPYHVDGVVWRPAPNRNEEGVWASSYQQFVQGSMNSCYRNFYVFVVN